MIAVFPDLTGVERSVPSQPDAEHGPFSQSIVTTIGERTEVPEPREATSALAAWFMAGMSLAVAY